jgi:hypothetical protein
MMSVREIIMARRRIILFALVVAVAVFIAVRRPWDLPQQPAVPPGVDMKKMATLQCVIAGGGPCTVKVEGRTGSGLARFTYNLSGVSKSLTQHAEAPLELDAITVERDGKTHKQELTVAISAGQSREIRINADDSIEVVTP